MAYENLELLLAGLSGDIYLSKTNKDGTMNDSRRIITDECIRATTEWFMKNDKKVIGYTDLPDGRKPYLFHTSNKDKAERIIKILKEDEDN